MIDFKGYTAQLKAAMEQLEAGTAWLDEDFSPLMADNIEQLSECIVNFADLTNNYNSIEEAPTYPKGFTKMLKKYHRVKNGKLLSDLRNIIEPGEWKKVYYDGLIGERKASIHYFESKSGQVCDVKVVYDKWSNESTWRIKC